MSREMHSFGLDPSELEESRSMMPTICLHWKEEGAHYQLADTSLYIYIYIYIYIMVNTVVKALVIHQ
jgi:hypothetical protein